MSGLLGEIGKKVGEKWVSLLALPGLLFLGLVTVAWILGQGRALDMALLRDRLTALGADPDYRSTGAVVLILVAVVMGSVAVGLAATVTGHVVEWFWHRPGGWFPLNCLRSLRGWRWRRQVAKADAPDASAAQIAKASLAADGICLVEPSRPLWTGDRFQVVYLRVARTYGLDLAATWPRLWLALPEHVQKEIARAYDAYMATARLFGWAFLYALLIPRWYPALLLVLVILATAQIKARRAVRVLADLIESAVDVYYRDLLTLLGRSPVHQRFDPGHGSLASSWFRKSRWDPDSPLSE